MTRTLVALILLIASLTGCTTIPTRKPEVEIKLTEANSALDRLNERINQFFSAVEVIRQDTLSLYRQPEWTDIQEVVESASLSENPEDDALTVLEAMEASGEWGRRWDTPWQSLFARYLSLVQRCNALEIRRLLLLSDLRGVQSKYLAAILELSSLEDDAEGQPMYAIVEVLDKSADELDAYTTNSIGLYDVSP